MRYTKRKKQKRLRRLGLFTLIVILLLSASSYIIDGFTSQYANIGEKHSKYYSGQGQTKSYGKDGFTTTFKTSDGKEFKEYKQNDGSWENNDYWNGSMAENGCGITSMAIIISGYGKENTPEDLRQRYYPVLDYDTMSNELLNLYNINSSGFYYDSHHLSAESIVNHLKTDNPVLVCVWDNLGKNRWTTRSHYMVLLAADDSDKIYVSNPNGKDRTFKSSGWYPTDEIIPYIAKAMYID